MTRPPAEPVALDEAMRLIATLPRPAVATETVALGAAAGRRLAASAVARWPLPRFDAAAMDGWALATRDLAPDRDTLLPSRGRIAAGEDATGRTVAGGAVRIFTGAMMPYDADAVVMQEHAAAAGDMVRVPPGVRPGQHRRRCGEQADAGAVTVPAGRRLGAPDLALMAAGGATEAVVARPLRAGVLATGNEVRAPGLPLSPGAIPDANSAMVAALLAGRGALPSSYGIVGDDPAALASRLRTMAAECDLIVTTGGVSVGEEDHLRGALEGLGRLLFWRIAMKPGRPSALGLIGAVPVLALPGNPAAAFATFCLIGDPLLRHLTGDPIAPSLLPARSTFDHRKARGIAEVIAVSLGVHDGTVQATRTAAGRGTLAAFAEADALAVLPADRATIAAGDVIPVLCLNLGR